ncbi:Phosphatidylinositol-glycan biosynthesis class F protein [Oopsacas minuta]|uniref:Phosphatidylinositol-glycan biosynthesis class F protein n=1 Tax=Oopsacas minuta TaxID=111878 RepID=A0AAV7KA61_9METZ|nr:Phosphatidylinositol-glycan biosynthesis class F protein [Oopsacas minuta]
MDLLLTEVFPMITISLLAYYFTTYSRILTSSCIISLSYLFIKSLVYFRNNSSASRAIVVRRYIHSLIVTLLAIIPIHCIFIAFGAALFENKTETLVLSFTVSILTVLPCTFSFRINYRYFISKLLLLELYSLEELDLVVQVYSVCVCVWMSAFPILLDWDKPWQKWPIPCLAGTWIGYSCSKIISFILHSMDISRKFTHRSYSLLS